MITYTYMKKEYLVTFVVSSFNREKYLIRLLENLKKEKNNKYQLIIINDNSTDDYAFFKNKNNLQENWIFIENNENKGKFLNFYQNKNLYLGKYICFLDDKDFFTENWYKYLYEIIETSNEIIIGDYLKLDNNIMGNKFNHKNIHEFYFKKCQVGDKIMFFLTSDFLNFKYNWEKYKDEKIYNHDLFLLDHLYDKIKILEIPIAYRQYLDNGNTSNNNSLKINNYKYYYDINFMKMKHKASLKFMCYRCFEFWIIRKKIKLSFPNIKYKLLYYLLFYSFSFFIINWLSKKITRKITR